ACGYNIELLKSQIKEFSPLYVYTIERHQDLENEFKSVKFFFGENGLKNLVKVNENCMVLNALVGSSGLVPTLEAIKSHKKVLLANKETLVTGGEIVKEYLKKYDGKLYPIDSEHTGLWELIDEYGRDNIKYLTITASGGAFRDTPLNKLKKMKKEDALKHPNWKMGAKITIDSATMMNKVFELIEAHYLFDMPMDRINALIDRTSQVHALVTLKDGSTNLALGAVSMRNPIVRALYYPELRYRTESGKLGNIKFEMIDESRYPSFGLAKKVMDLGGLYPTILNAANEAAVKLFLEDKIEYTKIYEINNLSLVKYQPKEALTLENILKYDKIVKEWVLKTYGKEN
ncbi:MAG: 1-deoxy-D-xylulose-5-phosphate reductoisomerase, partial [Gammaproteobacteria bacterium]|nr:1-deoxy-D-xylulose-5-phosphate reductoisomerase [Gammaproteobacteria bacterium]